MRKYLFISAAALLLCMAASAQGRPGDGPKEVIVKTSYKTKDDARKALSELLTDRHFEISTNQGSEVTAYMPAPRGEDGKGAKAPSGSEKPGIKAVITTTGGVVCVKLTRLGAGPGKDKGEKPATPPKDDKDGRRPGPPPGGMGGHGGGMSLTDIAESLQYISYEAFAN